MPHGSYDRFHHCQLTLDLIYGDILAEKVMGFFLGLIVCPKAFSYLPMIIIRAEQLLVEVLANNMMSCAKRRLFIYSFLSPLECFSKVLVT